MTGPGRVGGSPATAGPAAGEPVIEARGLRVDLGGRSILRDVELSVAAGELVYLLGRNGAGKSTLLRTLCGMVTPTAGEVRVDGTPVRRFSSPARRLGVHLGTEPVHPGHTARRHLRWLAAAAGIDRGRIDEVLTLTGVDAYGDRWIGEYSLGMRQRLGIASALLPLAPGSGAPRVGRHRAAGSGVPAGGAARALVFDEPLNGLDVEGIVWLRELLTGLAAGGCAVLVASHLLGEVARSADRVVLIDGGTASPARTVDAFRGEHPDLEAAYLAAIGREVPA